MPLNIDTTLLKGRHVYLEFLQPGHRETLRILACDERVWEFTKTLLMGERFDQLFDAYFDTALDPAAMGGQQAFVIRQVADGAIIGMTRFYGIIPADRRLEIGYTWYIPAVWGKAHNKECKLLLLQYVFETLGWFRAEFKVAGQNLRSQRAVAKIGGVKEGVLRKTGFRPDGALRDTVIFSIIDDEWAGKKEKLLQLIADCENR
jgi:RimJ/RimL family protein N-acetyltransferase